jgi:hypothetical protein
MAAIGVRVTSDMNQWDPFVKVYIIQITSGMVVTHVTVTFVKVLGELPHGERMKYFI